MNNKLAKIAALLGAINVPADGLFLEPRKSDKHESTDFNKLPPKQST